MIKTANLICLSVYFACGQLLSWQGVGDESQRPAVAQNELPSGAIWRIGEFGPSSGNNGYYHLAYSPDSNFLATRNRDNFVTIYNVVTRKELCQLEGGDGLISCIDFSPDSKFFLTTAAGEDERVKVWNTQTGKLESEFGSNASVAYFSPNGNRVICLAEKYVETYTFPGGEKVDSVKWRSQNNVRRHTMSRDGRLVVVSTVLNNRLNQVQILDLENKSRTILDGPTEEIKKIGISQNGLWVAASYSRDPKIRLWDLRDPHNEKFVLSKQKQTVQSLSFSTDGRFLVSTSWDNTSVVWDILTREPVAHFQGHQANVNSSAFSPLDLTLATGASGIKDSSVLVWDLQSQLFPDREIPKAFDSFEVIWKELGSNFPAQSFMAVQAIVQNGDQFVEHISSKIGVELQGNSHNEIKKWIAELDSPKYKIREAATQKLLAARGIADPLLHEALIDPPSTEVKYRITLILRQPIMRPKINFDQLRRLHRSVFALELIGSLKAVEVLTAIAGGHANIDVARDASDALTRIQVR